jgi:trans-2,3-dihydro-3-hydroxyanthranilate isomerase
MSAASARLWSAPCGDGSTPRRYVIADVFTDTPLQGNQLAVFTDGRGLSAGLMQRAARELNLSETVFFLPPEHDGDLRIRIFTPVSELPFAGHPVLGSAFLAGELLQAAAVRLETGLGVVPVELRRQGEQIVSGQMEQPVPGWGTYEHPERLLAALGVAGSGLPVEFYQNGPRHVYVAVDDEPAVAALRPDTGALADLGAIGVNCFAGSGHRWKTRMFAPGLGVPEDPATGSAAGPLAIHLARHGRTGFGEEIEIRQGAEIGRPSVLYARVEGSPERIERVLVGGSAVVVARGEYRLA